MARTKAHHAPENLALMKALADVRARIQRDKGRNIGEENTKSNPIEPVLEVLGCATGGPLPRP